MLRLAMERKESLLLADWTSLHLDIIARDRGPHLPPTNERAVSVSCVTIRTLMLTLGHAGKTVSGSVVYWAGEFSRRLERRIELKEPSG